MRLLVTGTEGAAGAAAWVMRWKGFVETSFCGAGGAGAGGAAAADDASEDCDIILKYGLRLSRSAGGLDVTICGGGGGGGGVDCRSGSWVGVDA